MEELLRFITVWFETQGTYITTHPLLMIAMALAFSFGESIVFIGVLIPGSVVIILLGGLTASQSVFVFAGVMMSALVGSILGDLVSFFWGRRVDRSGKLPSKVYTPSLVEKGRRFFNKLGGITIFLGRFVGPVRGMVSFVAGMMQYRTGKFMIYNSLGGVVWTVLHAGAGRMAGKNWHLAEEKLGKTSLYLILILVLIIIVYSQFQNIKKALGKSR